jgi:hypothetical protein
MELEQLHAKDNSRLESHGKSVPNKPRLKQWDLTNLTNGTTYKLCTVPGQMLDEFRAARNLHGTSSLLATESPQHVERPKQCWVQVWHRGNNPINCHFFRLLDIHKNTKCISKVCIVFPQKHLQDGALQLSWLVYNPISI